MIDHALDYAAKGWAVFPCIWYGENAKAPLTGNGFKDATTDPDTVRKWWIRYPKAMIGAPVPAKLVVIDIDPRNGGNIDDLPPLPPTLTAWSGRNDGGRHLYFIRPVGDLTSANLPRGVDLKASGYTILPPSIHPATGNPYRWGLHPIAAAPPALKEILRRPPRPPQAKKWGSSITYFGVSIADDYCASHTWADVLEPHGWGCKSIDGDADGAIWLHPTHSSGCSATVKNSCLFVYSTNTPFPVTEPDHPQGLTKFRAYAILNHGGDMSAAAAALRGVAA